MRRLVVAVALAALAGCGDDEATAPPQPERADIGVVVQVLDGDTADIEIQGVVERVRFIGIDTPEPIGGRREAECFGDEASELTRRLLPEGTLVRLERDVEPRDVFDRLLAYVFRVDDDLFVNLHLAETGYADQLVIEPNSAYAGPIGRAVGAAREQDLGLWGACGGPDVPLG
ncbi:MAG: thermonuclease family protein [Actinomycetota bacterium]